VNADRVAQIDEIADALRRLRSITDGDDIAARDYGGECVVADSDKRI
jgi:hypothetical protein